MQQTWRIVYTTHRNIKMAVTKTKALKEGNASKAKFIVITAKDSTECLKEAKVKCSFNDNQLIGMRELTQKEISQLKSY